MGSEKMTATTRHVLAYSGVLATWLLAACSSPLAPPAAEVLQQVQPLERPVGFTMAVAPVGVAASATAPPVGEAAWAPVPVDPARLDGAVELAVRHSGLCSEGQLVWLSQQGGPSDYLQQAFDAGAEVLLSLEVTRHRVRFVDRNDWLVPNVINFILFIFPAWFVADEQYAGEMTVRARLLSVSTGQPLWQRTLDVSPINDLNHFERGWSFFGIFTVPDELEARNFEQAAQRVMPWAVNQVAEQLARGLVAVGDPLRDQQDALSQTLGLVVGVGRSDGRLPQLRVASDDGRAFADLLRERGANGRSATRGVPEYGLEVLVEQQTGREPILAGVTRLADRARPGDTVVLYYSGYGFSTPNGLYLVPYDLDPTRPEATAISLTAFLEPLTDCPARQVVVLDTSFGGQPPAGRPIRTLGPDLLRDIQPASGEAIQARLAELATEGRAIVMGTAPGRPAGAISPLFEDQRGLFTARMVDVWKAGQADQDGDGQLSLQEAFEVVRRETARLSARAGMTQAPRLYGSEELAGAIPWMGLTR